MTSDELHALIINPKLRFAADRCGQSIHPTARRYRKASALMNSAGQ